MKVKGGWNNQPNREKNICYMKNEVMYLSPVFACGLIGRHGYDPF